jgi:hypothetical protein
VEALEVPSRGHRPPSQREDGLRQIPNIDAEREGGLRFLLAVILTVWGAVLLSPIAAAWPRFHSLTEPASVGRFDHNKTPLLSVVYFPTGPTGLCSWQVVRESYS